MFVALKTPEADGECGKRSPQPVAEKNKITTDPEYSALSERCDHGIAIYT